MRSSLMAIFAAAAMLFGMTVFVFGESATANTAAAIVPPAGGASGPDDVAEVQGAIYESVEKQAHSLIAKLHPWRTNNSMVLMTDSGSTEHFVRPNAGLVQGLCFLYRFGEYNPRIVGVDKLKLLNDNIVPMIRYLCATHETGTRKTDDGKAWGKSWQSALWATMLGRGAWWVWRDLPPDLQQGVAKVVAYEADAVAERVPPHQVAFDTKAEENAWNSGIFSAAMVLMPNDGRVSAWQGAFQRWTMSSFLTVGDSRSDVVVDGKAVREQYNGATVHDDYTLENHRRVHPGYMNSFSLSLSCVLDYVMSGRTPPESVFYNVRPIYENIKWLTLPAGGSIFPQGQDWELQRVPGGVYLHIMTASRLGDPDGWSMMKPCLKALKLMQIRNACGAVFRPDEYFFPSSETDLIERFGMAWLELQYHEPIVNKPTERTGVRLFDEGRFMINRTATCAHVVSWGSEVMAQVNPFTADRMIEPHYNSGTGHVTLEGRNAPEMISLKRVEINNTAKTFDVSWQVLHGRSICAYQTLQSAEDGSFHVTEKLMALEDVTTSEVATGLIAILNNKSWIYEPGHRVVTADGNRHEMAAGAGTDFNQQGVHRIDIDGVIQATSGGKALNIQYRGAKEPLRARLVDELYLNYISDNKTFKKGQVISEYDVTIQCSLPETGK